MSDAIGPAVSERRSMLQRRGFQSALISLAAACALVVAASDSPAPPSVAAAPSVDSPAARGLRLLTTKAYLTQDFDQEAFDALPSTWEPEARKQAEQATPAERRRLIFERYGLTEHPDGARRTALQYVPSSNDGWTMNCLACHTGKVAGKVIYGVPNSLYDLQSLTEDVRTVKFLRGKPLTHMDKGSFLYPLGGSIGTTNAVSFGQILLAYRDRDLNFHREYELPKVTHHDMDAIPWWHYKRKQRIYVDAFAPRDHRALMQFLLIPRNGPDKFIEWEQDYRDIEAWILSLDAPKYPYAIDSGLAGQGKTAFTKHCAECHGTYTSEGGSDGDASWPEKIVPLAEIGTDPVRLEALTIGGRRKYGDSWFTRTAKTTTLTDPGGYVAPPLDGVWASAPYFHNGAVPTLWDVLHPTSRPVVWKRTIDGYDQERVGLDAARLDEVPKADKDVPRAARRYFDTRKPSKSAAGHTYPDALNEAEKRAVLEYLKTL
jgi:mono/diheme cytochrome c family protein